ncbi:MAG: hypothetical protein JWO73_778 [Candidatus Taylorbacteria bacterium]|nr:hypothetical protein [Candidatus Taylorbacteria bacterium]
MKSEQRAILTLNIVSFLIQKTLKEPNSRESKILAKNLSRSTNVGELEYHRFCNAVINDNVHRSFKPKRSFEISKAIFVAEVIRRKEFPTEELRKNLETLAKNLKLSYPDVLELFRLTYREIENAVFRKP